MLLKPEAYNRIKFFQDKEYYKFPEDEGDKIRECEKIFNQLTDPFFCRVHKRKGYAIALYELDQLYYLTSCVKAIDDTYITTVYIMPDKSDALVIAKFADKNISSIGNAYKKQITEGIKEYGKRSNKTSTSESC